MISMVLSGVILHWQQYGGKVTGICCLKKSNSLDSKRRCCRVGHLSDDNKILCCNRIVPNVLLSFVLSLVYRCQNYSMGPKLERHIP